MDFMQKQAELSRQLFDINSSTVREMFAIQQRGLERYMELNSSFGEKLRDVRSPADFVEMQREYGESLWAGVQESVESQTSVIRGAVEDGGKILREAFTPAGDEAETAAAA